MADIRVGMGVTGVAQFKSAMTQSRQAVKTLDAELKLNEAQYKKSGDAGTYMAQKTELLKKQIAEQEKVVKAAEEALDAMTKNGTDPASKSFQAMRQQLINAKTGLTTMQTQLKGVSDAGDKAADKTDDLNDSLKSIGKGVSFNNICTGISGIASVASSAINTVKQLAKALWNMEYGASQDADDILTLATNYGVSADYVQRLRYAEYATEISAEDYLAAMDKMYKNMSEENYRSLGIDPKGKSRQELMTAVIGELSKLYNSESLADQMEAEGYSQAVFGKSFRELGTITKYGVDWFNQTLAEQNPTSEENLEKLVEFNDAVQEVNNKLTTLRDDIAAELAPKMTDIATAFGDMVDRIDEWVKSPEGQAALSEFADAIKSVFDSITDETFKSGLSLVGDAITGLVSAFKWIVENYELVIAAFAFIAGSKALASIAKTLNGLGSVFNFGGGSGVNTGTPVMTPSNGTPVSPVTSNATPLNPVTTPSNGTPATNPAGSSGWSWSGAAWTALGALAKVGTIATIATAVASYVTMETADDESDPNWNNPMVAYITEHGAGRERLSVLERLDNGNITESDPLPVTIADVSPSFKYENAEQFTREAEGNGQIFADYISKYGLDEAYSMLGIDPTELHALQAKWDELNSANAISEGDVDETASQYVEWLNNEIYDAAAEHGDEIEAMGAYMVSRLMQGIKDSSIISGYSGSSVTSNLYIENMALASGTDETVLVNAVQRGLLQTRRGFGS